VIKRVSFISSIHNRHRQ